MTTYARGDVLAIDLLIHQLGCVFMKNKFIGILLFLFIFLCSYTLHSTTLAKSQDSSNVLILYSHHYNFEWTSELQKGISSALDSDGLYLYVEYLNEHQLSDTVSFSDYYASLMDEYKNVDFDCIILADNYAFNFMEQYYEDFKPETPLIFVGLNGFSEDMLFTDHMTGIPQTADPKQLLDLIVSINSTDPLIFISSKNATSIAAISAYERLIHTDYPTMNYEVISAKTLDDALLQLSNQKKAQLIMLGNIPQKNGTILSPSHLIDTIYQTSPLPIYTENRLHINDKISGGAVGGVVTDPYRHGYEAGLIAQRLINGENVEDIPIMIPSPTSYVFNYRMLKHFNIDEEILPSGSILLGKPNNRISLKRNIAISGIVLIALTILISIVLLLLLLMKIKDRNQIRCKNIALKLKTDKILLLINEDSVTHFLNRKSLENRIHQIHDVYDDFVLYGIAINNLHSVDEAYGYAYGNKGRLKVSQIIKDTLNGPKIVFGRYHDYFYVLDYNKPIPNNYKIIAKEFISRINKTMQIDECEIELSANVGIVFKSDALDDSNLLKLVDTSLMELQRHQLASYIRYDKSFQEMLYERLQMEVNLKKAMTAGDFSLHLQPQISLASEEVCGAEALIRWRFNDKDISPSVFIPIAEEMGLIEEVGLWVIDEAVKHINLIKAAGYHCPVAVNISAKQMNRKLVEKFTFLIQHQLIEASDLSIEITESILLDFIDIKADILHRISALGITISIDDFGTGYSSMKYLQCLPFNKLKIDKYFIDHIAVHKERALLKSMIFIAQGLSLESIAEGVETLDQINLLREMAVDTIQGWYYSKALPIDDFILYLKDHS